MTTLTPNEITKYRGALNRLPVDARFGELRSHRDASLTVARECSKLTKTLVVPPVGYTPSSTVTIPHQSHGGRLVSNLVSQLLLILFPPGVPFFKLDLKAVDVRELAKGTDLGTGTTMYDALRETFVGIENNCSIKLETMGLREKLRMILLQLVVGGNSCYLSLKEDLELIPLDDWVCSRDSSGDLLEVIYRQNLTITEALLKAIPGLDQPLLEQGVVTVYTRCYKQLGSTRWTVDKYVDSSPEPYETLEVPSGDFWVNIPVWELTPGEDYGRGPVEESLGDLRTYESGTRIIKDSATALAKVVFTVRPNGLTKASDVADAENTEIISGQPEDVGVIQASKAYDLNGFTQYLSGIKQDLDMAFMMPTVIRRDAERVTAEEIRRMATELEKSRGGTYNNLAKNLQGPVAELLIRNILSTTSAISGNIKAGDLLPIVNTGLQGLGRTLELESTLMFLNDLKLLPGLEMLINKHQLIQRLAALRGLELSSIIKSAEQLAQEQQQQAMSQVASAVLPQMLPQQ